MVFYRRRVAMPKRYTSRYKRRSTAPVNGRPFKRYKRQLISKALYTPKGNLTLLTPWPAKKYATLRYVNYNYQTLTNTDLATGTVRITAVCANGMFDPTTDTGDHKPMGMDQYAALYDHYRVLRSRITVHLATTYTASDAGRQVWFGIGLFDAVTTGRIMTHYSEDGRTKWMIYKNDSGTKATLSHSFDAAKYFGYPPNAPRESTTAAVTANPTEVAMFQIMFCNPAGVTYTGNVTCQYTYVVEYDVEFTEPKTPVQS